MPLHKHRKHHLMPLQIPEALARKTKLGLPEASELDVIRHYTRLIKRTFPLIQIFIL